MKTSQQYLSANGDINAYRYLFAISAFACIRLDATMNRLSARDRPSRAPTANERRGSALRGVDFVPSSRGPEDAEEGSAYESTDASNYGANTRVQSAPSICAAAAGPPDAVPDA
jgi:hypothetical protein